MLTIFTERFGKARQFHTTLHADSDGAREHIARTTDAVQAVVDTLRDPKTGAKYRVELGTGVTASTSEGAKLIKVTADPIFDDRLTVAQACTVMLGLTLHEIGHTLDTFPHSEQFRARFGKPGDVIGGDDGVLTHNFDRLAYHVLNIAEDARLEARMVERLPVAADCFPTTLDWVAGKANMKGRPMMWDARGPIKSRVDFFLWATRYPWTAKWAVDATTRAERKWWQDWRDRYVQVETGDAVRLIAYIEEALTRLREPNRDEPEPEPEPQPDEPGGDEPEPGEPEPGEGEPEPGEGEGEGESEPTDEDGDGDGSDDPTSDEDEGEDGEGDGDGDADDDTDEAGQPGDGKGGEQDGEDEPHPEGGDAPQGTDAPVVGDTPDRQPDDFTDGDITPDLHGLDTGYNPLSEAAGAIQREVNRLARVDLGKYGSARIDVRPISERYQP